MRVGSLPACRCLVALFIRNPETGRASSLPRRIGSAHPTQAEKGASDVNGVR